MKKRNVKLFCCFIVLFCLSTQQILQAADLTTKSGVTYEQFAVCGTPRDGSGIFILHKTKSGSYEKVLIPIADWPADKQEILDKYKSELLRKQKQYAEWLKTPAGKKYLAQKKKREEQLKKMETVKGRTDYVNKLRKEEEAAKKREAAIRKKEEEAQKKADEANKKRFLKSAKGGFVKAKK